MASLLEEVKEHFRFLYVSKGLVFRDINSYEFCDLKLIKDYKDQLTLEGRTLDGIFLSDLAMLYLYLTQCLNLRISVINEDTKRAGVDTIIEHLIPRLKDFRTSVMGCIKSIAEGINLDTECLNVFDISKEEHEEYVEREGIKEKDTRVNPELEKLKNFLRGENNYLNNISKKYVDAIRPKKC